MLASSFVTPRPLVSLVNFQFEPWYLMTFVARRRCSLNSRVVSLRRHWVILKGRAPRLAETKSDDGVDCYP